MNNFVLEIWYDEGSACTFYTVKWGDGTDETVSETDKFFDTYAVPGHELEEKAMQLFRLITESIGNRYGAIDDFFDREERAAQALPPRPKRRVEAIMQLGLHFPLRLYCYRVNEQVVVLFNGGVKDADTAQASKGLGIKFYEAQHFVQRLESALREKTIWVSDNERYLEGEEGINNIQF